MMKLHKYLVSQYLFPYYATTLPWASNPSIRDTYCVGRYCHCVCKPKCYQEVEDMTRPVTIISILVNTTLIPQSSYSIIHSSRCQYNEYYCRSNKRPFYFTTSSSNPASNPFCVSSFRHSQGFAATECLKEKLQKHPKPYSNLMV